MRSVAGNGFVIDRSTIASAIVEDFDSVSAQAKSAAPFQDSAPANRKNTGASYLRSGLEK
jgi:hypothetical protein